MKQHCVLKLKVILLVANKIARLHYHSFAYWRNVYDRHLNESLDIYIAKYTFSHFDLTSINSFMKLSTFGQLHLLSYVIVKMNI